MLNRIKQLVQKRLPSGSFARNVVTLMTGTTFAQAIPIAISPILTRMYSPEDFGVLALFVSITSIFGSIANARYELAIVLPVKDEDAINITVLCIVVAMCISIVLLIPILFFKDCLVLKLGNKDIAPWLYLVPLSVFLVGMFKALNYFHVRTKGFKDIARATINKSTAAAAAQLGLGVIKSGATGLITGQMLSFITGNTVLFRNILARKELLKAINKQDIKRLALRYIDFPKFSMWSILANTLSYNLVNIFISNLFGAATLGFYSLGNRVLGSPASLVGNSIGQVYFQRATEEKQKTGSATKVFLNTTKSLVMIGLPPFLVLFFILEDLFAFVFGDEWRIAGTYAKIMLPLYFVNFVTSPVTTTNSVFEKQKISLIWQLSLLFVSITIIATAKVFGFNTIMFMRTFSIASMSLYIILWFILLRVSRGESKA